MEFVTVCPSKSDRKKIQQFLRVSENMPLRALHESEFLHEILGPNCDPPGHAQRAIAANTASPGFAQRWWSPKKSDLSESGAKGVESPLPIPENYGKGTSWWVYRWFPFRHQQFNFRHGQIHPHVKTLRIRLILVVIGPSLGRWNTTKIQDKQVPSIIVVNFNSCWFIAVSGNETMKRNWIAGLTRILIKSQKPRGSEKSTKVPGQPGMRLKGLYQKNMFFSKKNQLVSKGYEGKMVEAPTLATSSHTKLPGSSSWSPENKNATPPVFF